MRKIVTARWHVYNKIRSHKPEVRSYIKIYTNVPKKENKNNSTMGSNCEEPEERDESMKENAKSWGVA